jgi:hypothetical protein
MVIADQPQTARAITDTTTACIKIKECIEDKHVIIVGFRPIKIGLGSAGRKEVRLRPAGYRSPMRRSLMIGIV